jgi:predicted secreted hydrolase
MHTWGFSPAIDQGLVQYHLFGLRLADGRDIFLGDIHLRGASNIGSIRTGSISRPNGHMTILHTNDFSYTPTSYWRRDATCTYPTAFNITVKGMHLHVQAAVPQTELRALRWPVVYALWPEWPDYWNGPSLITGPSTGRGWFENGGYCVT